MKQSKQRDCSCGCHMPQEPLKLFQRNHSPASEGTLPWGTPSYSPSLTQTLRSPRAPAGGPLLEPERPGRVAAEGANPFRKERRDRSDVMLIRPQQAHESSTNAASVCWMPRHWRQRSCPSSEDRKDRNQEDTDETASWKRRDRPWFALLEFAL